MTEQALELDLLVAEGLPRPTRDALDELLAAASFWGFEAAGPTPWAVTDQDGRLVAANQAELAAGGWPDLAAASRQRRPDPTAHAAVTAAGLLAPDEHLERLRPGSNVRWYATQALTWRADPQPTLTLWRRRDVTAAIGAAEGAALELRRSDDRQVWGVWCSSVLARVRAGLSDPQVSLAQIAEAVHEGALALTRSEIGYVGLRGDPDRAWRPLVVGRERPLPGRLPGAAAGAETAAGWGVAPFVQGLCMTNDPSGSPPLRRLLQVPVFLGTEPVGEIQVANGAHDYTEEHLAVVAQLAELYALAVQAQRTEAALAASEASCRGFHDNALVGSYTFRVADQVLEQANDRLAQMLGYGTARDLLASDPVVPLLADRRTREGILRELVPGNHLPETATRLRQRDGTVVWLSQSAWLCDGGARCVVVAADITSQVTVARARDEAVAQLAQAQSDLQRQMAVQSAVLDAVPLPVFVQNAAGRVLLANRAFAEQHGVGPDELVGQHLLDLCDATEAAEHRALDSELLVFGGRSERLVRRGDQVLAIHKAVATDAAGQCCGLCTALVDLTPRPASTDHSSAAR